MSLLLDEIASPFSVGMIGISTGGFVGHVLATREKRIGAIALLSSSPDWLTASPDLAPSPGSPMAMALSNISPVNHPIAYAPTAIMMVNGDQDLTVSCVGSQLLFERLTPLYESAGLSGKLELHIVPGLGHACPHEMRQEACDWLQGQLLDC